MHLGCIGWFQSTLPRRERPTLSKFRRNSAGFNPRSREGSDAIRDAVHAIKAGFQSTLPRRERPCKYLSPFRHQCFNPRSREGSDYFLYRAMSVYKWFQSTLPRRERLSLAILCGPIPRFQSTLPRRERLCAFSFDVYTYGFNPRSREGSDERQVYASNGYWVSIHAPAKGATFRLSAIITKLYLFQSTLPRRERQFHGTTCGWHSCFNPRSREGSDQIYV